MRSISERDLAVVIPLLAARIRDLATALAATDERLEDLTDEELDDRMELQETLQQYDEVLATLRAEYEAGLADVSNLPSYEALTARWLGRD